VNLETLLRELDSAEVDLSGRLERVRLSANAIWAHQRLVWFTDHTSTRHSRRIIQLLGELLDRLQGTDQALHRSELFVLLTAAYVHDIGMQDFRIGDRGPETFAIDDYELIRDRHPARAKDLIVQRVLRIDPERGDFRIDLDDRLEYLLPIALVSQGHGSAFFESTLDEFNRADYAPENHPLRGALLTALLLMADELDLHEDRALFPQEMAQSPLVSLHHHVNHYVTRVSVRAGTPPRRRVMQISFSFPPGSASYQAEVRSFVVDKLARQARRVNPVLVGETAGELEIDPRAGVRETTESIAHARRPLPDSALRELRERTARHALIGRSRFVEDVLAWFADVTHVRWEIEAPEGGDLPLILRWLEAAATSSAAGWLHFNFAVAVGTEPEDILRRVSDEVAGVARDAVDDEGTATASSDPLVAPSGTMAEILALRAKPTICVFEAIDELEEQTLVWLRSELESAEGSAIPSLIIVTRRDSAPFAPGAKVIALGNIEVDAIVEHLSSEFGYWTESARRQAEEMIALSDGVPSRLHVAFAVRRLENFELVGNE